MRAVFAFLSRLFLSAIFIFTAVQDVLQWNSTEQYVYNTLTATFNSGLAGHGTFLILEVIIPKLSIFFAAAIFLKLLGGICVLFGWNIRFGAFLLLLFLIPITFIMHDFWNKTGIDKAQQLIEFWKNTGIAGGLLLLLTYGIPEAKKAAPSDKKAS